MISLPPSFDISLFISDLMPVCIAIVEIAVIFFSLRLILKLGRHIKQAW